MAAYSKNVERIIQKEIIRSTIGKSSSPLSIFDHGHDFVRGQIRQRISMASIADEVQQSEQLVQQAFSALLARSSASIFELTAEVRLEKISKEERSEIVRLELFSYFLTDFILYYPYAKSFVEKNTAEIVMSTASGESKIPINADGDVEILSRKFPIAFAGIHYSLTNFQQEIKQEIEILEEQVREQIPILDVPREQMSEKEQEDMLEKEKELFAKLSFESSRKFRIKAKTYFDTMLSVGRQEFPVEEPLKKQLIAVQAIQNDFAAALLTEEERARAVLKDFFMKTRGMPEKEAEDKALAALALKEGGKEEEKRERVEQASGSPRERARLSTTASSSSSSFYAVSKSLIDNPQPPVGESPAGPQTNSDIKPRLL